LAFIALLLVPIDGLGSPLKDMDRDLRGGDRSRPSKSDSEGENATDDRDEDDSGFGEILALAFVFGGSMSVARVEPSMSGFGGGVALRDNGEALIPYLRVDGASLALNSDDDSVPGLSLAAEAGWGPIAVIGQVAALDDGATRLVLTYGHLAYRMSFGSAVEVDLAFGAGEFDIGDPQRGFSFAMPVRIHPSRFWGIEFIPVFTDFEGANLQDYTVQALVGIDYVSFTLGWRVIETRFDLGAGETALGTRIHGPSVGFSLRY
ncbi:MAG: hypothetical protein AAFX94_13710, partial [Myxococcota bacterium]